jgi:hypothetical protein
MCNGAHKTHKRSGAQAQAKRLIPQNENKGLNENGHEEINLIRKVPQGLFKGTMQL